ncbi:FAD-binding protein [Glaciihabitans arcticus]|uniref:FAD-binding protein n=1 Tax=Glaciihabitans arcticus TaxID=2668039 RepID=A0A4Q9GY87_9MICO|nr:FAD-binding protein [Glaciihabitans arcticus]
MLEPGAVWRNWGRSQTVTPAHTARPTSVDEVVAVIAAARDRGLTVKAVGAGHSFTSIAATDGVQLDVSALDGVYAVDGTRVTLGAGTNLYQLPALLDPLGLALTNMGDIDRQTLAGATSTGTHGTGAVFGGLATQVVGLTLVTADATILTINEETNAELLPAARLGLGALGIVVDLTIQCVPSFALRAVEIPEPLEAVLDDFAARSTGVDHFEFYWFPHTDTALTKSNTRLPVETPPVRQSAVSSWIDDELLSNGVFAVTCGLGRLMPGMVPGINRIADKLVAQRDVTDLSHRIFVADRRVRFRESEYAIPRENVPEALRAIRSLVAEKGWKISFPIEVRVAAADENWLSTAYGRESGYIAVHRYYREDPTEYFEAVEAIMRGFEGRPHWGKMHFQNAESLAAVYPRFDDFRAVRDQLDPDRLFTNDYLRKVLGS